MSNAQPLSETDDAAAAAGDRRDPSPCSILRPQAWKPAFFQTGPARSDARGETADPSDPRWEMWATFAGERFAYSMGTGKFDDFDNREATFHQIADAFLNTRYNRADYLDESGATVAAKDGQAISGAILKVNVPADKMTPEQRAEAGVKAPEPGKKRKNFVNTNVDRVGRLLAYDIDNKDGAKHIERCRAKIRDRQIAASGYSTHNHTAVKEKGRIVLYTNRVIATVTREEREIYRRTYTLIGEHLFGKGVHDGSCSNPARVIYLPSHNGVTPVFSWFEPGTALDVTPFLEKARAQIAEEAAKHKARSSSAKADDHTYRALLSQVRPVINKYKDRLDLNAFFIQIGWEMRDEGVSDSDVKCPFDAAHGNPEDPDDRACHVWSPDASTTGAAHVNCEHDHCKNAHGEGYGRTCSEFVAKAMGSMNPPVGIEALLDHVAWTEEEKQARSSHAKRHAEWAELAELGADRKALMEVIAALDRAADGYREDLNRVLRAMSTIADPVALEEAHYAVKRKTGLTLTAMREAIEQKREQHRRDSCPLDVSGDADVVDIPLAPRSGEEIEEYDREIIASWDLPLQLAIARSQIRRRNEADPRLFTRKGDPIALRLADTDGRFTLNEPDDNAWSDALVDLVRFRRISSTIDRIAGMPTELSGPIKGSPARLGLPVVDGIIRTPLFGRNGTLITARGYNKDLKLILDPNDVFDPPSLKPSNDEVLEAVKILEDVICDFPFSDHFTGEEPLPYKMGKPDAPGYRETNFERGRGSRWNVWGAMLHPQTRHLMGDGSSAPPYHIDKAQPGEGAGYLMNAINIVLTGSELPVRVFNDKNPGEFEKGIPAALRAGDPMIGIDNIIGTIRSGPLAAVMTSSVFVARRFGKNDEELRIPTTAMWMFAGNNARFGDELTDRMVPIGLNSGLTKPAEERAAKRSEYFKYPEQPYPDYVKSQRRRVVWALHTLIARWFADGCPGAGCVHPRFPEYSAVVGGILENAARIVGGPCGFLTNLDAYKDATKEDANAYAAVYQRIIDKMGHRSEIIFSMTEAVDALRDPLGRNLDPDLNLPISGKTPHGEVVAFAGLFRAELRLRPFDVKVDRRSADRHRWPILADLGGGRVSTRLKFVSSGKADSERWRVVPVDPVP